MFVACIELIEGPSSTTVQYASSVELQCSANSKGSITFVWHQKDFGIKRINHYTHDGEFNVTDTILVSNITDDQRHVCVVISRGQEITSREAAITVLNKPSKSNQEKVQISNLYSFRFCKSNGSRSQWNFI